MGSVSSSRAVSVVGHHTLQTFFPGNSCSSLTNLPFESIKMIMSASVGIFGFFLLVGGVVVLVIVGIGCGVVVRFRLTGGGF